MPTTRCKRKQRTAEADSESPIGNGDTPQFLPPLCHKVLSDTIGIRHITSIHRARPHPPGSFASNPKPQNTNIPMNHPYLPALQHARRSSRSYKPLLLIPAAGLALACSSCAESKSDATPPIITDTAPVGDGLKVIGYAVVAFGVLGVLGRMLK